MKLTTTQKLLILLLLWVWLGGGIGGSPPPYPAPTPTAMILEDDTIQGRQKLQGEQDDIMRAQFDGSVRQQILKVLNGDFQVLSYNNTAELDKDWAKAAFTAAKKSGVPPPLVIAASPKAGVKPQPLPMKMDEARKLLAPIGVK